VKATFDIFKKKLTNTNILTVYFHLVVTHTINSAHILQTHLNQSRFEIITPVE